MGLSPRTGPLDGIVLPRGVLVHGLEPADVVVGVANQVNLQPWLLVGNG